jgi:hypothetical protein
MDLLLASGLILNEHVVTLEDGEEQLYRRCLVGVGGAEAHGNA